MIDVTKTTTRLSGGVEKRRVMEGKLQEAVAALEMEMALTTRRGGEKRGS